MKLLILLLLPLSLLAQKLPTDSNGKITYTETIEAPGLTQAQLHDKAKLWIASNFQSAKAVTELDQPEAIVVKGITSYVIKNVPNPLHFTLKLYFKDGKYKYEATDFLDKDRQTVESGLLNPKVMYKPDGSVRGFYQSIYDGLKAGMQGVGESFKKGMSENKDF